jgi:hypothetical protein
LSAGGSQCGAPILFENGCIKIHLVITALSDLHRLPPPRNPHIAIDLLELLRILRMYRDLNVGIDRLDRILKVAFAASWPERAIVLELLAQIPWYHHIVAGWETRIVEELPKALAGSLPTVGEIEAE